jgi:hypothetical protein
MSMVMSVRMGVHSRLMSVHMGVHSRLMSVHMGVHSRLMSLVVKVIHFFVKFYKLKTSVSGQGLLNKIQVLSQKHINTKAFIPSIACRTWLRPLLAHQYCTSSQRLFSMISVAWQVRLTNQMLTSAICFSSRVVRPASQRECEVVSVRVVPEVENSVLHRLAQLVYLGKCCQRCPCCRA